MVYSGSNVYIEPPMYTILLQNPLNVISCDLYFPAIKKVIHISR